MDDHDCDGMDRYRRRNADLDELLRIAARELRAAEELLKQQKAIGDELGYLPAHPRFARYVNKLPFREQEDWIDRMRNRYGEDF